MSAEAHASGEAEFYGSVPVLAGFANVLDAGSYVPVPDSWLIGVADVVDSTGAIEAGRYKTVNMAGAAIIAAVRNALGGKDLPFVFGGDGASFLVAPGDAPTAREALAATAAWVRDDLDLELRVALVPVAAARRSGLDLRLARFAPSPNVGYAMFSGGGLAWAEAAMKRGEFAVEPAAPGTHPDLTGLSCRFEQLPASNGVMLSLLAVPAAGAEEEFRTLAREIVALVEASPAMGRPIPPTGPVTRWPPQGLDLEVRAGRSRAPLGLRRAGVLAKTLASFLIFRFGIPVGRFSPGRYLREVVENTDFRKYDDGLRMTLDCRPELADEIERRLARAEEAGTVRFGTHRQGAAIMTCITPAPAESSHVHFVDGAAGGYALAARRLKLRAAAQPG